MAHGLSTSARGPDFPACRSRSPGRISQVTLVEPRAKTCAFLRHVARTLALANVPVIEGRIEEVGGQTFDVGDHPGASATSPAGWAEAPFLDRRTASCSPGRRPRTLWRRLSAGVSSSSGTIPIPGLRTASDRHLPPALIRGECSTWNTRQFSLGPSPDTVHNPRPHEPHRRDRQPEGRGRKDHDRDQPRGRAGGVRPAGPPRRPRSAGQRDLGPGPLEARGIDGLQRPAVGPDRQARSVRPTSPTSGSCRPAAISSGAEIELVEQVDREARLRFALGRVRSSYDFVLIDCPPSLSLLTVNALTAADSVLVPIQTEYFALEGLTELLETVERVRDSFNPMLVDGRHRLDHVRRAD